MLALTRASASATHSTEQPRYRAQCYRCFKPAATCICSTVTRVAIRTGILILQHPRERLHAIGTVRFARLGLSLDGTRTHARKMYAAQTWLHALPQVGLTPATPSPYRLRREPRPDYVATLEAIVAALRILEPETDGLDARVRSFAAMIDRQSAYGAARAR